MSEHQDKPLVDKVEADSSLVAQSIVVHGDLHVGSRNELKIQPSHGKTQYRRIYYQGFDFGELCEDEIEMRLDKFWLVGRRDSWDGKVEHGVHRLSNLKEPDAQVNNHIHYSEPEDKPIDLADCRVTVKVKVCPPNDSHSGAGIMFRAIPEVAKYYVFLLNAGSNVTLGEAIDGRMRFLWSAEIRDISADSFTLLSVAGRGREIDLFVNDILVYTLKGAALLQGDPGVYALSLGNFYFDDFALYLPVSQSAA